MERKNRIRTHDYGRYWLTHDTGHYARVTDNPAAALHREQKKKLKYLFVPDTHKIPITNQHRRRYNIKHSSKHKHDTDNCKVKYISVPEILPDWQLS